MTWATSRTRIWVTQWSRVALGVAVVLVGIGWVKADQKVASLEYQRDRADDRGVVTRGRITELERRVTVLERPAPSSTTTTGTTTPGPVVGRKPVVRKPGSTTSPTTRPVVAVVPTTTQPKRRHCAVFVPIGHGCLVSVTLPLVHVG